MLESVENGSSLIQLRMRFFFFFFWLKLINTFWRIRLKRCKHGCRHVYNLYWKDKRNFFFFLNSKLIIQKFYFINLFTEINTMSSIKYNIILIIIIILTKKKCLFTFSWKLSLTELKKKRKRRKKSLRSEGFHSST